MTLRNRVSGKTFQAAQAVLLGALLSCSQIGFADATRVNPSAEPIRVNPSSTSSHQPDFAPTFEIPFSTRCASGFSKGGEKKKNRYGQQWTKNYVCTTPVISCPKQPQNNGKYSYVHPKAIVQTVGGDPDGGEVHFRVQYKCVYSWNVIPEG